MKVQIRKRETYQSEEHGQLACYASCVDRSRGRLYEEREHPYRTAYQRDRDRIVHSRAFRRLEHKTQVFIFQEGDHYRNRLTHTLEASQIARTSARALRGNEDLAEALVLAHDLGHTPFGHAGEHVLAELVLEDGGFDHNRQTLRIVDWLEDSYPDFRGLNLTYETREGILKHGCHWPHPVKVPDPTASPHFEAQLADAADEIAYLNHDLDDGLRSCVLSLDEVSKLEIWRVASVGARARHSSPMKKPSVSEIIVALIDVLNSDLLEATALRLSSWKISSSEDVQSQSQRVVAYSPEIDSGRKELKKFLYDKFYHHPKVLRMSQKASEILTDLYRTYCKSSRELPDSVVDRFSIDGEIRAVVDYIAGMTDRFALAEYSRLVEKR